MSELDYVPDINFALLVQCLFGIVYLSTYQWQRNKWLVLVFLSIFLVQLGVFYGSGTPSIYQKLLIGNPGMFLAISPSLYLFTKELVLVRINRRELFVHFLPALIFYVLSLFSNETQPDVLTASFFEGNFHPLALSLLLVLFIINLIYTGLFLKLIRHNSKKYKDEYAETSIYLTLDWLKYLVFTILILSMIGILAVISSQYFSALSIPHFWVELVFLFIISATSYFAFRQPTLYKEVEKQDLVKEKTTIEEKETKPLLNKQRIEKISLDLEHYFTTEQPFLDPKIRMPEIAAAIDSTPHELSWFLNEHQQTNFFTLINERRVNYAAQLLKNENYTQYTLEAISKMAGFRSKTTFNNWFKKMKNMTPSAFRKANLKD